MEFIFKIPFLILHELSHIVVNIIFAKNFSISYKFFEIVDGSMVLCEVCIDVDGENDFGVALGSIMPNIIYYTLLILTFINYSYGMNIEKLLFYIYVLSGIDIATCSIQDKKVFSEYIKK